MSDQTTPPEEGFKHAHSYQRGGLVKLPEPSPFARTYELYRAQGWTNTLPLPARAKSFPPKGFTGRDGRTVLHNDLEGFLTVPDANIALRMPPNVIGLDVDHYGAKHGLDQLAELEDELGALPPTWAVTSRPGTGSSTRFYRLPPGVDSADLAGSVAWHIETIRHVHRYSVVWPSVHPDGRLYVWENPAGEQEDLPVRPGSLPLLPQAWIDFLQGRVSTATEPRPAGAEGQGDPEATMRRIKEHLYRLSRTPDGPGADICFQTARMVGEIAAGAALNRDRIETMCLRALDSWTFNGRGRHAMAYQLRNGLNKGYENPVPWFAEPLDAPAPEGPPSVPALDQPTLPLQLTREELVQKLGEEQLLRHDAREYMVEALRRRNPTPSIKSRLLPRSELHVLPPVEFMVSRFLPRRGVAVLYGRRNVGKTFLALDMALCVATGKRWAPLNGDEHPYFGTQQGRVVWVAGEGVIGLKPRIEAWEKHYNVTVPDENFTLVNGPVQLSSEADAIEMAALVSELGANLVVFDTLAKNSSGLDENKTADMVVFFNRVRRVQMATDDTTALVIHHQGKNPEVRSARGSSVVEDDPESVFNLVDHPSGAAVLHTTKQRDCAKHEPLNFRLAERVMIREEYQEELSEEEKKENHNDARRGNLDRAREALTARRSSAPRAHQVAVDVLQENGPMSSGQWVAAIARRHPDASPDSIYQWMSRARKDGLVEGDKNMYSLVEDTNRLF